MFLHKRNKTNPKVMPQNWQLTGAVQFRSGPISLNSAATVSKGGCSVSLPKPNAHGWLLSLDVVWYLQKPSGSKHGPSFFPAPYPSARQSLLGFTSHPHYSGSLLPHHPTVKDCPVSFFSKWSTSHLSWRPEMKPCGLSKVCIFSISGNRGSI